MWQPPVHRDHTRVDDSCFLLSSAPPLPRTTTARIREYLITRVVSIQFLCTSEHHRSFRSFVDSAKATRAHSYTHFHLRRDSSAYLRTDESLSLPRLITRKERTIHFSNFAYIDVSIDVVEINDGEGKRCGEKERNCRENCLFRITREEGG